MNIKKIFEKVFVKKMSQNQASFSQLLCHVHIIIYHDITNIIAKPNLNN